MKQLLLVFVFSLATLGTQAQALKLPSSVSKEFVEIPAGTLYLDGDSVRLRTYFISATEITNKQYRDYLVDLQTQNRAVEYKASLPDSTVWNLNFEAYSKHYFRHPAYNNYPMVGITKQGAELYCRWLNEKLVLEANGNYKVEVHLPSQYEWMYAANGGAKHVVYTWGTPVLENAKGEKLCNFKMLGAENIHFNDSTGNYEVMSAVDFHPFMYNQSDNADITAPVKSYHPNAYGLYNMNGNVAEMIRNQDIAMGGSWNSSGYDVRNASVVSFVKPNIYTGFRPVIKLEK